MCNYSISTVGWLRYSVSLDVMFDSRLVEKSVGVVRWCTDNDFHSTTILPLSVLRVQLRYRVD